MNTKTYPKTYKRPPVRRRRGRRYAYGRLYLLIALVAVAFVLFGILRSSTADEVDEAYEPPNLEVESIDISLLQSEMDSVERRISFSYGLLPLDLSRHIVVDPNGFVELITFSPPTQTMHVYTTVPVVYEAHYSYETNNVYIHIHNPRDLYSRIVILDPGEGGSEPGAVVNNIRESDINLEIALLVYERLEHSQSGIKAFMTRRDDRFVSLSDRPFISNNIADMFVSIHNNGFGGSNPHLVYGTEVLFNPIEPHITHGNSGRLNIDNRSLAQIFQDELVNELGTRDRGVLEIRHIAVLEANRVPAVLLEVEFMTNPSSLSNLLDPDFQNRAADAIYRGIVKGFESMNENTDV